MNKKRITITENVRKGLIKYLTKAQHLQTIDNPINPAKLEWCVKVLNNMCNWSYQHDYFTERQAEVTTDVVKIIKKVELPKTDLPF